MIGQLQEHDLSLLKSHVLCPTVFIDYYLESEKHCHLVLIDGFSGMHRLIKNLIETYHYRKLCFVGSIINISQAEVIKIQIPFPTIMTIYAHGQITIYNQNFACCNTIGILVISPRLYTRCYFYSILSNAIFSFVYGTIQMKSYRRNACTTYYLYRQRIGTIRNSCEILSKIKCPIISMDTI